MELWRFMGLEMEEMEDIADVGRATGVVAWVK